MQQTKDTTLGSIRAPRRTRGTVRLALAAVVTLALSPALAGVGLAAAAATTAAKHKAHHRRKPHKKHKKKGKGRQHASAGHTLKLTGGSLQLSFTSAAWSHMNASTAGNSISAPGSASTTPVAPATASSSGTFTFPIAGGSLNSASGRGTVTSSGGIAVANSGGITGFFSSSTSGSASSPEAVIGPLSKLTLSSENFVPAGPVAMFTLSATAAAPKVGAGTITLSNIPAGLTQQGAEFFGVVGSFKSGEGIATVTIQGTD